MEKKETRNKQIHFLVNDTEAELIKKKMDEAGFTSIGAYMRKMAIDGYTIRLDLITQVILRKQRKVNLLAHMPVIQRQ